jgi:preprotein translocase subunit SecE
LGGGVFAEDKVSEHNSHKWVRHPKEMFVAKKSKKPTTKKQQSSIRRFYRETVGELRKVTWPTRQEAINLTIIVIAVTFGMSAFLGIVDFLFSRLFALILGA